MKKLLLAFVGWGAMAFPTSVSAQESSVVRQLDDMVAATQGQGVVAGLRQLGALNDGESTSFTTFVPRPGLHLIAGACDNDCTDVNLAIEAAWVLGADNDPSDHPIIGPLDLYPNVTYTVYVTMVRCTVEPCNWGVQFFYPEP